MCDMPNQMKEEEMQKMFTWLRKPIFWDPIPWWIKLDKEKVAKFNEVQVRLNTKIAELEAEKIKELSKITGM